MQCSESCPSFNCDGPVSELDQLICPNADISGLGVVVGYAGNAGIVVIMVLVNYVLAYEPGNDPFKSRRASLSLTGSFEANPVDTLVLYSIRKKFGLPLTSRRRVQEALTKCVLWMSDFQILTGLSILISGFVQMNCGISTYHWKVLIYLAWFSSLTHFACLSFLRNYFVGHSTQRRWRLVLMITVVIMLIVAIIPTGLKPPKYQSTSTRTETTATINRAAILHNGAQPIICAFQHQNPWKTQDNVIYYNMIFSVVLVGTGMLLRFFKLYETFSATIYTRFRKPCSQQAISLLTLLHVWCRNDQHRLGLRRLLIYRPLLACFVILRILVDFYLSMLGEVFYIVVVFAWGLTQLILTRNSAYGGENDWSFGQIVPLVLLGAPLMAFYEYFSADQTSLPGHDTCLELNPMPVTEPTSNTHTTTSADSAIQVGEMHDDPKLDYYTAYTWMLYFIVSPIIAIASATAFSLYLTTRSDTLFNRAWASLLVTVFPLLAFSVSYFLIALLLEDYNSHVTGSVIIPRLSFWIHVILFAHVLTLTTLCFVTFYTYTSIIGAMYYLAALPSPLLVYFLAALTVQLRRG